MRITKLLSVFLAVLMLFSCVAGALATGVAAEETETETPAEYEYSYSDPREGASKIYYSLGGSATKEEAGLTDEDVVLTSGYNLFGVLLPTSGTKLTTYNFEAGSVLVVKFKGALKVESEASANYSRGLSPTLLFGAVTLFREDGTKLPIVIEGIEEEKASTLQFTASTTSRLDCANDYYFTNLTFKNNVTTVSHILQAGSGSITFDNCNLDYSEGKLQFNADCYSADAFLTWGTPVTGVTNNNSASWILDTAKFNANDKDNDGMIETGITFGAGTSFVRGSDSSRIFVHGVDAIGGAATYKGYAIAKGGTFTNDTVTGLESIMTRDTATYTLSSGKFNITNGASAYYWRDEAVRPWEIESTVVIDNGNTEATEADFGPITVRGGQRAGGANVIVYSGGVKSILLDQATKTSDSVASEVYYGDTSVKVLGGHVFGEVTDLNDAYLVGDLSYEFGGNAIVDGNVCAAPYNTHVDMISGDFSFTASGEPVLNGQYWGAHQSLNGTITNTISGGTFAEFSAIRYGGGNTTAVVNTITGGLFNGTFAGGNARSNKTVCASTTITNIIAGANTHEGTTDGAGANYPQFKGAFYAGSVKEGSEFASITTTVSDGFFSGGVNKCGGTFVVNSTKDTDIVKFQGSDFTYEIDTFTMAGGRLDFYKTTVIANNATGSVVARNTGSWAATDTYSISFPGAAGNLTVTCATAGTDETNVGKAVEENGDIYVTDGYVPAPATVEPEGARLIMDNAETAIGIKFYFDKEAVEAITGFTYDIALGGTSIANGDTFGDEDGYYTVVTYAVSLSDMNTAITFGGSVATEATYSLATIAAEAVAQWTAPKDANWLEWAKALVNLNNVHNLGLEAVEGGDMDKEYEEYTLNKGNLAADVAGLKADFTMSNVTGIRFTTTFNTMPTTLVVMVNGMEKTDIAVVEGNTVTIDLALAAQNMEKNIAVTVKDYTNSASDFYFEFIGSAAQLAQTIADTDAEAAAFLWYIQAAAQAPVAVA